VKYNPEHADGPRNPPGPNELIAPLGADGMSEANRARDARLIRAAADKVNPDSHDGFEMKRPSLGAILLALIPFAAMCFSVALWDRVDPMVLGIPFNLFWLISWIVFSTLCMWAAYRREAARDKKDDDTP